MKLTLSKSGFKAYSINLPKVSRQGFDFFLSKVQSFQVLEGKEVHYYSMYKSQLKFLSYSVAPRHSRYFSSTWESYGDNASATFKSKEMESCLP